MRIVDALWSPGANVLVLRCACGAEYKHPANRWQVTCPACGRRDHLEVIRERYLLDGGMPKPAAA